VLIPFTMQMALVIIGGYVVATTPAVYWLISKARDHQEPAFRHSLIAFFSMTASLFSWGSA